MGLLSDAAPQVADWRLRLPASTAVASLLLMLLRAPSDLESMANGPVD